MRITWNAPVTLTFAALCAVVYFVPFLSPAMQGSLSGLFVLGDRPNDYLSLPFYILGHANLEHLTGNMTLFLLLAPNVEERFGSLNLLWMMLITAVATGLLNMLLFPEGILGASGIVFMLIILSSFTNPKGGIPLTFILVALMYVGKEVVQGFQANDVSEFGHILGGILGSLFGFWSAKTRRLPEARPMFDLPKTD